MKHWGEIMNIVICDDDKYVRDEVEKILRLILMQEGREGNIYSVSSGEELLNFSKEYQILLLDIEMPGIDGIETGKMIRMRGNDCKIIMLTGMNHRFKEAFLISAFRFVTKPIEFEEIKEAVLDSINVLVGYKEIDVMDQRVHVSIKLNQIVYLKSMGNYVKVYAKNKVFTINCSLKSMEDTLLNSYFTQISRGVMVNLKYVQKIQNQDIYLKNGEVLKVSIRQRKKAYRDFVNYDLNICGVR